MCSTKRIQTIYKVINFYIDHLKKNVPVIISAKLKSEILQEDRISKSTCLHTSTAHVLVYITYHIHNNITYYMNIK